MERVEQCPECDYSTDTQRGLNIHIGRVHGNEEECKYCGEIFTYHPSSENKFCSEECYREWRQQKSKVKEAECNVCGDEFQYHPSAENGLFCSRECMYESDYSFIVPRNKEYQGGRFQETNCEKCGETFTYDTKKKKGMFCSQECFYQSEKDFPTPGRSLVERKEFHCEVCGDIVERLECDVVDSGRVFCSNDCRGEWVSRSDIFQTPSSVYVEETNRKVKSGWEAEMDRFLNDSDVDYEYESRVFDLGKYSYTPDFLVDDKVIEVKGQVTDRDIERAELFKENFPGYKYIVVGSSLPCDIHIKWDNMRSVLEVI